MLPFDFALCIRNNVDMPSSLAEFMVSFQIIFSPQSLYGWWI